MFRKKIFYLLIFFLAVLTTYFYHHSQVKWVYYRKAESYFNNRYFSQAINYYLKSAEKNLDPLYYKEKLAASAKSIGIYESVVEFYKNLLAKDDINNKLVEGLAFFYSQFDQYESSINLLKNFLEKKSDDNIRLLLARNYFYNKNFDKSIFEYSDILLSEKLPFQIKKIELMLEYARVLQYSKRFNDAINIYKTIISNDSKNVLACNELANVYLQKKDFNNAFQVLMKIPIKKLEDNTKFFLAKYYILNNEAHLGEKIYLRYLSKLSNSKEILERLNTPAQKDKDNTTIFLNFKFAYLSDKKLLIRQAYDLIVLKEYKDAIRIYQYLIQTEKETNPTLYGSLGDLYLLLFDKNNAIDAYQKAYELKPINLYKAKLALTLMWANDFELAFDLLKELYKENKNDLEITIAYFNAFLKKDDIYEAKLLLNHLLKNFPNSVDVKIQLAKYHTYLGHYQESVNLYNQLLKDDFFKEAVLLQKADDMILWGDFYKTEKIYKNYLLANPSNFEMKYKLAGLYEVMKRYEEAKQIYFELLSNSIDIERACLSLAKLYSKEKEFKKSYFNALSAYKLNRSDQNILALILALIDCQRIDEASTFLDSFRQNYYKKIAILEIGKAYFKKDKKNAQKYFDKFYMQFPDDIQFYFYSNILNVSSDDFIKELLKNTHNAKKLTTIAGLYADKKSDAAAEMFLRKAIKLEENYYPAKFYLAQLIWKKEKEAQDILDNLLKIFPENYQILLWKAKIYSWNENYCQSLKYYSVLQLLSPKDPVIIREKARVATWEIDDELAGKIYSVALSPSVDFLLYLELDTKLDLVKDEMFVNDFNYLKKSKSYLGYEKIKQNLNKYKILSNDKIIIEKSLLNQQANYEIQKSIFLEKEAKNLLYLKYYIHSNLTYKKLVHFSPYNEEALFDFGQTFCYLNLCDKSKIVYQKMKDDFSHNFAEKALERNVLKNHPNLDLCHNYYKESGFGNLDRIIRNRTDLSFNFSAQCRNRFMLSVIRWVEKPTYEKNTQIENVELLKGKKYDAYGYLFGFNSTFSKYINSSMGFSQKYYVDDKFKTVNMGYLNFSFNLKDYLKIFIGYDRKDKLDNIFSLRNDIITNSINISASSIIKRKFSIEALSQSVIYSDNNFMEIFDLDLKQKITEFPKILSISLHGEHRNTDKTNIFIFDGSNIVNIIHPYWTPTNYDGIWGMIMWYHDLSFYKFCGSEKRYYHLKLTSGIDTEKNPSIKFEAALFLEYKRWLFSLNGYVHRSKLWDSDSAFVEFKYNF